MDFIVLQKDKKKELKRNYALQKTRILDCFNEIKTCVGFYEKQAEKVLQD